MKTRPKRREDDEKMLDPVGIADADAVEVAVVMLSVRVMRCTEVGEKDGTAEGSNVMLALPDAMVYSNQCLSSLEQLLCEIQEIDGHQATAGGCIKALCDGDGRRRCE